MATLNPTNKNSIESFLKIKKIQDKLLKLDIKNAETFFIASFSNILLVDILIEVEKKTSFSSKQLFVVRVFSKEEYECPNNISSIPFISFEYSIKMVIEYSSSNAIFNVKALPSIKKRKLIIAMNNKDKHVVYKDILTDTLGLDWLSSSSFENVVEGYFENEETQYFNNENELEVFIDNLNYDISHLVDSVKDILDTYSDFSSQFDKQTIHNILSSHVSYLSLIGETSSSITDTLPRENILSLFYDKSYK